MGSRDSSRSSDENENENENISAAKGSLSKRNLQRQIAAWKERAEQARQADQAELLAHALKFLGECQNELAKLEEFNL